MLTSYEYPAAIHSDQLYGDVIFYGIVIVAAIALALVLETYFGRRPKSHRGRIRTMR